LSIDLAEYRRRLAEKFLGDSAEALEEQLRAGLPV